MSEFQYHEWQTINRLLTREEQSAVNGLSSHIEVSASKAVVTYHWSDFRHDPREVLLKYFDAYFYLANWGSLRLMFRFPKGLLDTTEINRYCDGDYVTFTTIGEYQILDIDLRPEEGDWEEEMDADLSDFIHLRGDLLEGDYRLLYLAWLKSMTFEATGFEDEESEENDLEPPVPPGLKKLSPALQSFVRVFDINPFLVQAAADASSDLKGPSSIDYQNLVSQLPRSECDTFLARMAEGDPGVRLSLRKRLGEFLPKETTSTTNRRPLQLLLNRAEQRKNAEKKRKTDEARRRHVAEMKALAQKEAQIWQQVDELLENGRRIASVYNEATALLEKLKQLADFQDTRDIFFSRVQGMAKKYAARPSLMDRWKKNRWL